MPFSTRKNQGARQRRHGRILATLAIVLALVGVSSVTAWAIPTNPRMAVELEANPSTTVFSGSPLSYVVKMSCSDPASCQETNFHLSAPPSASGPGVVQQPYPRGVTGATSNPDGSVDISYSASDSGQTYELNVYWPTDNGRSLPGDQTTTLTVTQPGTEAWTTSATITLLAGSDLRLDKSAASGTTAAPNENFSYRIHASVSHLDPVADHGKLMFESVTFVDTLPVGARYVSSNIYPTPAYDPDANTLTWTLNEWSDAAEWFVVVQFDESTVGSTLTNTVVADGTRIDGNTQRREASADVTVSRNVPPVHDLQFTKTGTAVVPGVPQVWTLSLGNTGNIGADFTVVDTLPQGLDLTGIALGYGRTNLSARSTVTFTHADATTSTVPLDLSTDGAVTAVPQGKPRVTKVSILATDLAAGNRVDFSLFSDVNVDALDPDQQRIENCATATVAGQDRTACATTGVSTKPVPEPRIAKSNLTNTPVAPGGEIAFRLELSNLVATRWLPDLYDTIPAQLTYLPKSFALDTEHSAAGCPVATEFTEQVVPGWTGGMGAGQKERDLVRWTYQGDSGITSLKCYYTYSATVKAGSVDGNYTGWGYAGDYGGNRVWGMDRVQTLPDNSNGWSSDIFDVDMDGNRTEAAAISSADFAVGSASAAWIAKRVTGDRDGGKWFDSAERPGMENESGTSTPGGSVSYDIKLGNMGNRDITRLVAYDLLPLPGNTGVTDGRYTDQPSGDNLWTPTMTGPIDTAGVPVTVTYSEKPDPCRPEMDTSESRTASFYCGGAQDSSWRTADKVTSWSAIRSIRFDFGDHVFAGGDSFHLTWTMKAPTKLADGSPIRGGEPTWNKVAVQAERVSGATLLAAEAPWVVDRMFVPAPPATFAIGDFTWIDADGDGVQDADESAVPGVAVRLLDEAGAQLATTTSDESGFYRFDGLAAGNYVVEFAEIDGHFRTLPLQEGDRGVDSDADQVTGRSGVVSLVEGGANVTPSVPSDGVSAPLINRTIDAGYVPTPPKPSGSFAIGDFTWIDADGDGVQDAGEKVLPGVAVTLLDGAGAQVATTTSDESGFYRFDGLSAGDYTVVFGEVAGYSRTDSQSGSDRGVDSDADQVTGRSGVVSLVEGGANVTPSVPSDGVSAPLINRTIDAGYVPTPPKPSGSFAIGDFTWIDADGDGVQDAGEKVLPGVAVTLLDGAGAQVATTTSDESGFYRFDGLSAGDYTVVFGEVAGYSRTDSQSGSDRGVDSDADQVTGRSGVVSLVEGGANVTPSVPSDGVSAPLINRTIDAGYVPSTVGPSGTPSPPPPPPSPTPSVSVSSDGKLVPVPSGGTANPGLAPTNVNRQLPRTGSDVLGIVGAASLLTSAGLGLMMLVRRRQAV